MAKCQKCGREGETQAALGELGPSLCLPCLMGEAAVNVDAGERLWMALDDFAYSTKIESTPESSFVLGVMFGARLALASPAAAKDMRSSFTRFGDGQDSERRLLAERNELAVIDNLLTVWSKAAGVRK